MEFFPEDALKIGLAILVGGLIGAEREYRDKAAGFRTIIFITVGATLFTLFSLKMGGAEDPVRIAANIVTGIGFLGAGAIMREGGKVAGLTTAATIWLAASLGMGIGSSHYQLVGLALLVIMLVLWVFPLFEGWIDNVRESRTYEIVLPLHSELRQTLSDAFIANRLYIFKHGEVKSGDRAITTWAISGRVVNHKKLVALLMENPEVLEFNY
ncbi:MAG: MgtC/SapB family protein [Anaerolineales bacterium]|nr:MgtC/SapB family protein [Anaerolineales bacterium]